MAEVKVKALVWSEFTEPKDIYPKGIHGDITEYLNSCGDVEAKSAQLADPEQGVSEAMLKWADVLICGDIKNTVMSQMRAFSE